MSILIFLLLSYILLNVALYFIFGKTGVDKNKAFIPVVNFMEWCTLIGRPTWWAFLLFIPIVNLFIFVGMAVDMTRSFGRYGFMDSALSVIYAPGMLMYLGYSNDEKYQGPVLTAEKEYADQMQAALASGRKLEYEKLSKKNPFIKSGGREWIESVFFAVFAAAFIRMFLLEAYVIPTPSMEGSLNVGDFLFVSKAHYGIRTPMTIAMIPLLHNTIPKFGGESYLEKPSLPYYRLPAIENVDRNEPIVFNWPIGDSIYLTSRRSYNINQVKRNPSMKQSDTELIAMERNQDYITRPLDKKDHYIKRCIAVAGDTLQIRNKQVFINSQQAENPEHLQHMYIVEFPPANINRKKLEEWGIDQSDMASAGGLGGSGAYFLDDKQVEQLKSLNSEIVITPRQNRSEPTTLFPHDPVHFNKWSVDNYGPIWIPKKGATVTLTDANIALYRRAITNYEHNTLQEKDGQFVINGEATDKYTFKQNYYWAMGDNRHNSEDSRAWGFVPFDHIVGKPLFIWFSTKNGSISNGINWDRIFKSANDM